MGKLPWDASLLAAMSPSVAAGNRVSASALPTTGTKLTKDTAIMNKKNKPERASGWRRKVFKPSVTQSHPVRAGTRLSFIGGQSRCSGQIVADLRRLKNALAQHPLKMAWVVRGEHSGLARQMKVPQARGPKP